VYGVTHEIFIACDSRRGIFKVVDEIVIGNHSGSGSDSGSGSNTNGIRSRSEYQNMYEVRCDIE